LAASEKDRKAALEVLRNAQFVFGLSRYPKKQVLDDPRAVQALRERLEAMREAARSLSAGQREALAAAWSDLEAIDSGTEAVWRAAKRATPKIVAALQPLVSEEPEAAFLIAPTKRGGKAEPEPEPKIAKPPEKKTEPKRGLSGSEIAGLEQLVQQRAAAEEPYLAWLRTDRELALSEWRKRRAEVQKARTAEERYVDKLLASRSRRSR
jgi:hypothetical protein